MSSIWLVFYINNIYKSNQYKFLKSIRTYNIVIIILLVLRFIYFYVKGNLLYYIEPDLAPAYFEILIFSISIVTIILLYFMLNILLSFLEKSFTKSQNIMVFILGLIISLIFVIKSFFPEYLGSFFNWPNLIIENVFIFNLIVNNLEFLIIIIFYFVWSKKVKSKDKKRISKLFALFYIICNSLSLITLLILRQFSISTIMIFWIIQLLILSLFILAPFLWIKFVFIEYAQKMSRLVDVNSGLQCLYNKYNISKRERDIIELIIDGKGNNEIKETLFISYHTVKNHLSNIYRKLNVNNRHELVHLFIKGRKTES